MKSLILAVLMLAIAAPAAPCPPKTKYECKDLDQGRHDKRVHRVECKKK